MTCPACQQSNPDGARFCLGCGGALAAAGAVVPADPQRAALERALGAQYEIDRLLGRGGMGAVYLAREKALERAVAIKVLPPDTAGDADTRERFRREARVAAKLTHPNIVPLHTFGDVEGMLYFVMGYVKGESLADRLRREGKLPAEEVRRILAEVADALHYAHKQGVVHRDIKPDNILLEEETGRPMLTDFGVAKAKASGATLTEAGAVVGTPYYMSPEQASGVREIDGRTDLYALGVMGYQMLAGRVPFEGETFQDVIVQHVTKEPAPLAVLVPDAPTDLTEAVMRCLAKAPAQRWADGQQLRAALDLSDDEYEVPAAEAQLDAAGFAAAAGAWAGSLFGLACYVFPVLRTGYFPFLGGIAWWAIPAFFAGLGPAILGLKMVSAHRKGIGWSTIRRRLLHSPRWWPFWWPRRWRRAGDVWDRLPSPLRWSRSLMGGSLVVSFLLSLPLWTIGLAGALDRPGWVWLLLGSFGVPLWAFSGASIAPTWWAKRRGIADDLNRIAFAPTSRMAIWRQPKFAALLLPPAGRTAVAKRAEPQSPEELVHAIGELVGQLPSETRATVSEAGEAARQVADLIASLDAELANLARDADPQELATIEERLRALGPETGDEGDVRRQKRALLVNQRDLLRQLDARLATLADRRARLLDLLRTMWLQVANLRAEAAHDTLAVTEISGRIKALCTEIDAHVKAAETVRLELK